MHPADGRVVSNFITQALAGQPLTVYGDGAQTRAFCYVDDLVDALVRLTEAPASGMPVNLGNPRETTMLEIAQEVLRATGSRSPVEMRPLPADDPHQRCPDISLARSLLGWEPRTSLEEGQRHTVDYFAARLAAQAHAQGAPGNVVPVSATAREARAVVLNK